METHGRRIPGNRTVPGRKLRAGLANAARMCRIGERPGPDGGHRLGRGHQRRRCARRLRAAGLLVLTAKTRLRLLPPLILTQEDVDKALAILRTVLLEKL